jgi:CheY-like chemotaxis protein
MTRVVVVDDNELTLPGFVLALESSAEVEIVAAFDHDAALAWSGDWAGVDVVVLDAADEARDGDQFPGVEVVRRIRERAGEQRPVIAIVTGHYLHDGLRHRMAAAGAYFYFLRSDLRSADVLVDVVLHPDRHRRGVPPVLDPQAPHALGVSRSSDVEAFVGWVEERQLGGVLDGEGPARSDPRSRRWSRVRRDAAAAGCIEPRNMTTGDVPIGRVTPSIRQLARLWQWAARIGRSE